jgi:hypothetical protein
MTIAKIFGNIKNYFNLTKETNMTKTKSIVLLIIVLLVGAIIQFLFNVIPIGKSKTEIPYTLSSDKDEVFYSPSTQRILLYNKQKEAAYTISLQDVDVFYSSTSGNLTSPTGKVLFYDIKNNNVKQILSDDLTQAIFAIKAAETNKEFSGVDSTPQKSGKNTKLPKGKIVQK